MNKEIASQVLAQIDRNELAQLACDLTSIPSPTGQEKGVADYILGWYESNGLKSVRQEVEIDRPNAVGILRGEGNGLSLGFNGHTDTSFTGTDADLRMVAKVEPESELKGVIAGDVVRGLGVSNMKGGVAAFMMAGKALKKSGVRLKGDVVLAAVVGEISRTPVGPWQSKEYRGEGVGTRHLLTHGMQTDYAVVADGSDLNIIWTQMGVVLTKISVFGKAEAAWGTNRRDFPMDQMNAIVKMTKVIGALEEWAAGFEEKYVYHSPTGPLFPKVNVGAIEGGAPYRPNYFPGVCNVYVDIRIPPQIRPVQVIHEIRQTLAGLGIEYDIEPYKSLMGYEGRGVEPLVASAHTVYEHLFGHPPKPEAPGRASIWTDTNIYNEMGIPAIKIGPRGRRIGPRNEEIAIDEMVKAAQIYALMALDICSRERP
ncbi:M20/M25/M40 family metallo-hydrolase [Ramlibacter sp. AW1]|uniref:M20/M25/M40 family metallo-hydrolase n=1 Tax=Ramlibacter aurantiacus TaxID=2801330 RepID=A0A936ZIQ7_9BURK|nr:M20/M25/M40 family metallo-hydrolase [Ramlibacter aurantiacus]MBL0420958.1 M20/M25/M40 family metallo-hydrolase [Ramlibacter aurantiacus]